MCLIFVVAFSISLLWLLSAAKLFVIRNLQLWCLNIKTKSYLVKDLLKSLTNYNEAGRYDVRQKVASERFVVFAVSFAKEANERVEMVLTETL